MVRITHEVRRNLAGTLRELCGTFAHGNAESPKHGTHTGKAFKSPVAAALTAEQVGGVGVEEGEALGC